MATVVLPSGREGTVSPPSTEKGPYVHGTSGEHVITNGTAKNEARQPAPYPKSRITLVDRYVDEPRKLRVVVIGGGLAGILNGVLLPKKVPGIDLVIYEKNADFGGTWYENTYPGVRCDIPSHVYQSTFSPKTDWSDLFAPGAEIRDYWQYVARKHDVYKLAKFQHRVDGLVWDAELGKWALNVRNLANGEVLHDKADFVLTCIGRFNAWRLPEYPGMDEYKGILRHASHWDPDFDPRGKRVAVIGNGASGLQLVPNLQRTVAHLDHYARSKTWIAASWAGDERTLDPQPYSGEQKEALGKNPEAYLAFRKEMEDKYWRKFSSFIRGSQANASVRALFTKVMAERLSKKPELLEQILPDFSPNCRRLTPAPGYLEALQAPNVAFIRTPITRFTETGIEAEDGTHREVDAVFCATGANGDMVPPFPIHGTNGTELSAVWEEFPYTYLGAATPGFPNLFFVHGPHGTGPGGTVPHSVETQVTFYAKLLRKASREGIKAMVPSKAATDDFVEYCDAFFAQTVLTEGCSSWYNGGKPGNRIHGLWPGSGVHVSMVRREPRWEDWEYEYLEAGQGNRFAWYFGNGGTREEQEDGSDLTGYLRVGGDVDLRNVHENWWSVN